MKLIKQISVFVENKAGRLSDIRNVIGKIGIDISALSIADTTDFGIVRMIVNDPDKAAEILKSNNLVVKVTDVIALAVADKPGGLAGEIEKLKNAGISIEYMYAFIGKSDKGALVIVRVENPEKALEVLKDNVSHDDGGALYASGSAAGGDSSTSLDTSVAESSFEKNEAGGSGGAV